MDPQVVKEMALPETLSTIVNEMYKFREFCKDCRKNAFRPDISLPTNAPPVLLPPSMDFDSIPHLAANLTKTIPCKHCDSLPADQHDQNEGVSPFRTSSNHCFPRPLPIGY